MKTLIIIVVTLLSIVGFAYPAAAYDDQVAIHAYAKCLMENGKRGDYTSSDNGDSAMRLEQVCIKQARDWVHYACEPHSGSSDCYMQAVVLAANALQIMRK